MNKSKWIKTLAIATIVAGTLAFCEEEDPTQVYEWKSASGHSFKGAFVKLANGFVEIKGEDGALVKPAWGQLDADSRTRAENFAKKAKATALVEENPKAEAETFEKEMKAIKRGGKTTPTGWLDNYAAAQELSKKSNRPILVLFTGSDWCGWCIKLRKEVLESKEFKNYAAEKLILLYVDSPREKLSSSQIEKNEAVTKELGAGGGVPSTVIVSADGTKLGKVGGYSDKYLDLVKGIVEKK